MLHISSKSYFSLVIFAFSLFNLISKTLAISTDKLAYLNQLDNNNYSTLSKLISTTSPLWKNWKNLLFTLIALGIPTTLFFLKPSILNYIWDSMFNNSSRGNFMNRRRFRFDKKNDPTYQKVQKKGGNIGGLINDGNTCFMNSVLQSLASSNSLMDYLDEESKSKEVDFTIAFKKLLDHLNSKHFSKNHDYKTNPMLKTMTKSPNKNFLLGYNQEDAQEFFQSLLSELESDYKKIHSSSSTTNKTEPIYNTELPSDAVHGIEQLGHLGPVYIPSSQIDPNLQDANLKSSQFNLITPVDGLSAERIGCLQCGEMGGIRYSVISGLSLNLPPDNYSALKLTDLLKTWIEPEIIEGVDCNRCALNAVLDYQTNHLQILESKENKSEKLIDLLKTRIGEIKNELQKPIIDDEIFKKLHTENMIKKCSKAKQILISRPPPLLAIHINRSVFDPMTYRVRKNNAKVVFPLKLDLDPFVAEPNDINTDARLPLSKKVVHDLQEENEDVQDEDDDQAQDQHNQSSSSLETPEGSEKQDDDESEKQTQESLKTKTTELNSDGSDSDLDSEEEEERTYPTNSTSIPTTIEKQDLSGPLVYALRSVIVHYGTHNYGHYIAYRKFRGVWWRTSDETIDIVDEDEVLSAPGVFMLFYELDSLSKEEEDLEDLENEVQDVKISGESDEEEDNEEEDSKSDNELEEEEINDESEEGNNLAQTIANL
ncbi:Ubiquitin carboxyl-terminal hydrolase [Wickerhamomyces ciferrii]|uniref:Ubiquitin carboxyl-terminal hydrolase n=1 Tax=Wickerhamomyces ciferrii (strain ATCC 14091 / BCRC 22168 / CBS 111 / JCM 3599 / NBRC 0793 / NRRL Y-1031 F-60-10) TaxID=1206466 RepID=K0KIN7_WICCF|nr:Ubiquitin carboxyl-terminal hydrolase [Wickerhamomyces ciferrii]CCH42042.1 Ubiquitin carboxyl-terminal hydrolase [Wickerhamomyces ciferrii]